MNDFQKWCSEILPVVQAGAEGVDIQVSAGDGNWHKKGEKERSFCAGFKYRIKPRTIKVNGFDVPEPMSERPKEGDVIYVVTLYSPTGEQASSMPHSGSRWCNSGNQNFWLNHGLIHATKEAAIAHAKAMIGIDPNKED